MSDAGTATKALSCERVFCAPEPSATTMRLVPMSRPTAPAFTLAASLPFDAAAET